MLRIKENNKGVTLIEVCMSILILGILIIVFNNIFMTGVKSLNNSTQQLAGKKEVRQAVWQNTAAENNKIGDDLQRLTGITEADEHSITLIIENNDYYQDNNGNGLFDSTETIVYDSNGDRIYNNGVDTCLLNPAAITFNGFLHTFPRRIKHVDDGATQFRYDNSETIINDLNDNGIFDLDPFGVVEPVISGAAPAINTALVPFGDTIRNYLDLTNTRLYRVVNSGSPEELSNKILEFKLTYYDLNGVELVTLPLNPALRDAIRNIELTMQVDSNGDGKSDSNITTTFHPRNLDSNYGGK